jgi:hypothetical protein
VHGKTIQIDYLSADGQSDRFPALDGYNIVSEDDLRMADDVRRCAADYADALLDKPGHHRRNHTPGALPRQPGPPATASRGGVAEETRSGVRI